MQPFFQHFADKVPGADDGGFGQQNIFNLAEKRRNDFVIAEFGIYPQLQRLDTVGQLFGKIDGFRKYARRNQRQKRDNAEQKQNVNRNDHTPAAPTIFPANAPRYAEDNKTHDKSDKDQPEHVPEKKQQQHKNRPDEINPVYPDKLRNAERHDCLLGFEKIHPFLSM